jgi:hypothetical protein
MALMGGVSILGQVPLWCPLSGALLAGIGLVSWSCNSGMIGVWRAWS